MIVATRKKWLIMEDMKFPIVRWDPSYNTGRCLTSVWVRIHGFPYDLWQWKEFNRLFSPYGAVVLEINSGTHARYDYRFARVRIGIGNPPPVHSLTHRVLLDLFLLLISSLKLKMQTLKVYMHGGEGSMAGLTIVVPLSVSTPHLQVPLSFQYHLLHFHSTWRKIPPPP